MKGSEVEEKRPLLYSSVSLSLRLSFECEAQPHTPNCCAALLDNEITFANLGLRYF